MAGKRSNGWTRFSRREQPGAVRGFITSASGRFRQLLARLERPDARRLLILILILSLLSASFSCLVIGGAWLSITDFTTPLPGGLSEAQATATFGAQIFYQQLTAESGIK